MSYGRQRLNEIASTSDEGAFSKDFLLEMADKPFTALQPTDFEALLAKGVSVQIKLTKLQRREVIKSILMEHKIIVQTQGIEVINPLSVAYNAVLQMILKDVGGRLHCPLCDSKHVISCCDCRWEVQWF